MTDKNKQLCLDLMRAETEDEVISALAIADLWDNADHWMPFGGVPNNFSTIGNQQGEAVAALVEKLVNAIDARLTGECLAAGISPTDNSLAPRSASKAIVDFFGSPLAEWSDQEMLAHARSITLTASGSLPSQGFPSLSIADSGEGQEPRQFQSTFLSLNSTNKLNIPFVQGKFNMGGTGALQFCGTRHNFQLIVSRRRPGLSSIGSTSDSGRWGFTIVRRRDPEGDMRSSIYEYLAPSEEIFSFDSDTLPIFPNERPTDSDKPSPYGTEAEWGTLLKLYSYRIDGDRSSIIGRTGLVRRVEAMMPRSMLPVRFIDARYSRHSGMTAFGVENRLERESERVLERNFPVSGAISVGETQLRVSLYAFKPKQVKTYRPAARSAVVFLVNGQTHASFGTSFFRRTKVRKDYVANDLFVSVDCISLAGRAREDLFLNSRDRMREGTLKVEIERELSEFLREHPALVSLNQSRREALIAGRVAEQRGARDQIAAKLLRDDRELRKLLLEGGVIDVGTGDQAESNAFVGRRFPTFFNLRRPKERDGLASMSVAKGSRILLEFQTDAEDSYFSRSESPGRWRVTELLTGVDVTQLFSDRGPSEGVWNCWSNSLSKQFDVGDEISLGFEVEDDDPEEFEPFVSIVNVSIKPTPSSNGVKRPKEPQSPPGLRLPEVIPVWEDPPEGERSWSDLAAQGLEITGSTVVEVRGNEGSDEIDEYDIYLNMDNVNLVRRRRQSTNDIALLDALWENAYILLTLSVLRDHAMYSKGSTSDTEYRDTASEFVVRTTRAVAPVVASLRDLVMAIDATPAEDFDTK